MKTYLELTDGRSNKFWEISVTGNRVTTRWGKVGTEGQSKTRTVSDNKSAKAEAEKLIEQKKKKGYVTVQPYKTKIGGKTEASKDQVEFNPRKHIQIKIKLPVKISNYLSKVRKRIFSNTDFLKKELKRQKLPNNINKVDYALSLLSQKNNNLVLDFKLTKLDLMLIWSSPQSKYISQISSKSLDFTYHRSKYSKAISRFEKLFGVACPDDFLKIYDLIDKINKLFHPKYQLDMTLLSFDYWGLSSFIFSNSKMPDNALILNKYGHHELNYSPYASYRSDAVTYGLIYDYFRREFITSVYHGDGAVSPYNNIMQPFIEKFTTVWKYAGRGVGYYDDIGDDQLIEELVNPDEYDYDELFENLKSHTISLIIKGYLTVNPTKKQSFVNADKLRYIYTFINDATEKLQKIFKEYYLFKYTIPLTPISLRNFDTVNKGLIDNKVELIESLADLYAKLSPKSVCPFFVDNPYKKLRSILKKPYSKDVIQAKSLREFMEDNNKYLEKNRKKLFSLIKQAFKELYEWAESKTRNGAQGYGFITALIFWDNCPDGVPSHYSVALLDMLDENICPAYIKNMAKQHAPVRHDRLIPT